MTNKYSEAMAAIIRTELDSLSDISGDAADCGREACENIAKDMAGVFAGANPSFDRARFLKACGL